MGLTQSLRPSSTVEEGDSDRETGEGSRFDTPVTTPVADPLSRRVLVGIGAFFLLTTFIQAPGLIEDDTKLPVIMSPLAWTESVLHFWNQGFYSGSIQESNFGYLVPMAPFFALTNLLHIPTWCAERIWLALLLTVGCWGMVRLAESLGIGKPWARVLGGMAYCVSPIVVTWTGRTAALLAVVLLPWLLQPLVVGSREGSPRRSAAKSGVALALMGGVNATVVFATLPVGVLWLLTRAPGPRRRALSAWWIVCIGLACAWWAIPTYLQGKYGYNYLPITETSAVTTSTTSVVEALRGTSYWVNYFAVGGPLIPGAWTLVTSALAILGTVFVVALGLVGLVRRIPERLFLVASVAMGVLVISIGYSGALAGPFSHQLQHQLQFGLAPLRSVSKFAPDVALPVSLGLVWLVSTAPLGSMRRRLTRWPLALRSARPLLGAVAVVAVILAAMPFWKQQLYPTGGFTAIPAYWHQTAKWLDAHEGHQTALLVPGAPFADYIWGSPTDEPLQVLTSKSVNGRSLVPLGSNGQTVMLTAIDTALRQGNPSPGLARYLSRSGIAYVIERNDLDLGKTGAPPPAQVHQVLSETPGLVQVAAFGPYEGPHQVAYGDLPVYNSPSSLHLRAVQIFKVEPPVSEVQTYPASNPVVVSGSSDSLLPLSELNVLNGRAAVLAGDKYSAGAAASRGATWAITDGNQRGAVSFGSISNNLSYLLGPHETPSWVTAGVPLNFAVVDGPNTETVADPIGARAVSASSFGSTPFFEEPNEGPAAAFDDDPNTAWVASSTNDSVGQWVSITFKHAVPLTSIRISPLDDSTRRPTIRRVTITTSTGAVERSLPAGAGPYRVRVKPGPSKFLKITIDATRPSKLPPFLFPLGAGITKVEIPGVSFVPAEQVPTSELAAFSGADRKDPVLNLSSPISNANLDLNLPNGTDTVEPETARVTLPKTMTAAISGTAVPITGADLENAIAFVGTPASQKVSISASSWLGELPRFRPSNLIQKSTYPWIAGLSDTHPSLNLHWQGAVSVGSLSIRTTKQASVPHELVVSDEHNRADRRTVAIPPGGGTVTFAPMTTDSIILTFADVSHRTTAVPANNIPIPLPVGLASVGVPALHAVVPAAVPRSTKISICGVGPTVTVDGVAMKTEVTGTLGDLLNLTPISFHACAPTTTRLSAGSHIISFPSGGVFRLTGLTAQSPNSSAAVLRPTKPRSARVVSWSAAKRTLDLSAGAATYVQVSQTFNVGWVAKLNGAKLTAVRLNGWEQGWIVPAGGAGAMTMALAPDGIYRLGLLLGALFLVILAVLAIRMGKGAALDPLGRRRRLPGWVLGLIAGVVAVSVGGWLALALIPLIAVAHRWGSAAVAAVAGATFIAAGVVIAWQPSALLVLRQGAFSPAAQIFSVVALCALLSVVVVEERRGYRPPDEPGELSS
jgi:arabinofuranan 3-O-arabinosyltransferase